MPLFSFTYSIPYLCLFAILGILSIWEKETKHKVPSLYHIRYIWGVIFILFFGLRGFIGEDWGNYYQWFEAAPTLGTASFGQIIRESISEPGFCLYLSLVKTICPNYHAFVLTSVTITFFVLDHFFLRYSRYYCLSFIAFLSFLGLGILIDTARNLLSMMLFIASIPFLVDRKAKKYFLLNILGLTFHSSSVVYFLIYPFIHKKIPKKILISIFILCNAIFVFQVPLIRPVLAVIGDLIDGRINELINFYSNIQTAYGLSFGFIERNVTFLLVILFYDRLSRTAPINRVMANMYVLYFTSFCLFSEIGVVAIRISMLFIVSYWILYPNILFEIRLYWNKVIFTAFYLLLCIFKITIGTNAIIYKYDNLLWGIENYNERTQNIAEPYQKNTR